MNPYLVVSDGRGRLFVHPRLGALGRSGADIVPVESAAWVPMPPGSTLFFMPGHRAFGQDPVFGEAVPVDEQGGRPVFPVAAFPVPGFTRLYLPPAQKTDPSVTLPLWPYTAVGWAGGRFWIAAFPIDPSRRQRPCHYKDRGAIERGIGRFLKCFPKNRLVRHLARCARSYNCRNAQDLFLGRWEAPLPVSPSCNARCLGCISFQEAGCEASHQRLAFVPHPEEIVEIAVTHFRRARPAIASFGQGCEGEPLLSFDVVRRAVRGIRRLTKAGTLHMNTNGSRPERLRELASLGLDSARISVNSFDPDQYAAYYRPRGYDLSDVKKSFVVACQAGLFVSLNYLVFPGVTDCDSEVRRLEAFLRRGNVDLLQGRNLCLDPGRMGDLPSVGRGRPMGVAVMFRRLRERFPRLQHGYFNRAVRRPGI